jgi:hypothetical protein
MARPRQYSWASSGNHIWDLYIEITTPASALFSHWEIYNYSTNSYHSGPWCIVPAKHIKTCFSLLGSAFEPSPPNFDSPTELDSWLGQGVIKGLLIHSRMLHEAYKYKKEPQRER